MTKDRIQDLQKVRAQQGSMKKKGMQEATTPEKDDDQEIKIKEQETRVQVTKLQEDVKKVKKLHEDMLVSPLKYEETKKLLEATISQINTDTSSIRTNLKSIQIMLEEEEKKATKPGCLPMLLRMQKNEYEALLKTFSLALNDYFTAQSDYKDKCRAKIQRQLEIAGMDIKQEDLDKEDWSNGVFTHKIMTRTMEEKEMLANIKNRQTELLKLEDSLRELNSMFKDVQLLVETQGETVNQIAVSIGDAAITVNGGTEQLSRVQRLKQSFKKKKIYLALVGAAVALGIVVIIVAF